MKSWRRWGQTQEDYLPSEIEKFKDATGYEEFLDFDMAEVTAALNDPAKSRVDEMLAAAERAEREYAAEAAAYVQTPADIVAQARAVQDQAAENSFSIYQLKAATKRWTIVSSRWTASTATVFP